MKVPVLCLLFALAFHDAESHGVSKDKVVCAKKDEMLKALKGRDGLQGKPGLRGDGGHPGDNSKLQGWPGDVGLPGMPGIPGPTGQKGNEGMPGPGGAYGEDGEPGQKGEKGVCGDDGMPGWMGGAGLPGFAGAKGEPGLPGLPGAKIKPMIELSLLNDYYVAENSYYNRVYHVTSRDLTDGRADTGGWGSATAKTGNYIQASYLRPVYVTSVTVAGGYIPSWGHDTRQGYGMMSLEYSTDRSLWQLAMKMKTSVNQTMITHRLTAPVTAQYWRLISMEDQWAGTTEFALRPLNAKFAEMQASKSDGS